MIGIIMLAMPEVYPSITVQLLTVIAGLRESREELIT